MEGFNLCICFHRNLNPETELRRIFGSKIINSGYGVAHIAIATVHFLQCMQVFSVTTFVSLNVQEEEDSQQNSSQGVKVGEGDEGAGVCMWLCVCTHLLHCLLL